jgi:phosphatidylethanolamine-binding protein (PEBP) family uncharacterized protein
MTRLLAVMLLVHLPFITQCRKKSATDEAGDLTGVSDIGTVVVTGDQPVSGNPDVTVSTGKDGKSDVKTGAKPKAFSISGASTWTDARPPISWSKSENATSYDVSFSSSSDCSDPVVSQASVKALTWTATSDLANGVYYRCVTAKASGTRVAENNGLALTIEPSTLAFANLGLFINASTQAAFGVSGSCNEDPVTIIAEDSGSQSVTKTAACTNSAFSTTINATAFAEGNVNLLASTSSANAGYSLTKDTVAPTVNAPANDAVVTNSKTWTWSCSGATSCTYRHSIDAVAVATPGGSFADTSTAVLNSGNGTFYIHIQARDPAGNVSAVAHASAILDTAAPAVAITILSDVSLTNVASYSIAGTCDEAGESVAWAIDDRGPTSGGTASVTGTAACDGANWSANGIDVSSLLEGTLDVTATHADALGNENDDAETTFKDATAPLMAITSAPTANAAGQASYAFGGSCNEAGTVTWTIDDANVGTAPINGSTSCNGTAWTQTGVNVSSLDDGTLTITVDMEDTVGNSAAQDTATPTKNTTAPSLNLTAPVAINATNAGSYSIGGVCDVATGSVEWSIDDANGGTSAVTGTATCNGTTWSQTGINLSGLDDGTISFVVDMDDLGGNPAPTENASVAKDVIAPTVSLAAINVVNAGNASSFSFGGNCNENGRSVSYSVDDTGNGATSPVTGSAACNGTTWSVSSLSLTSLSDGTLAYTANLSDAAGNAATEATGSGSKDVAAPTVGINAVAAVGPSNEAAFAISGTCSENGRNVSVSVDDVGNAGSAAVTDTDSCASNVWSVTLNLSGLDDGTLNVTANHQDAAGNFATQASTTTTHDTTPPSVPNTFILQSPASNLSNNATPVLRFSSLAGSETIRVWTDAGCTAEIASGTAAGINLNVTVTLVTDDDYDFWATAEDALGNRSACSTTTIAYTLDSQISAITSINLASPATSPGNVATPTVTVAGVGVDDTVKLYTSGSCFVSEQIGFAVATGASVVVGVDAGEFVTDGTYNIYARSSDAAGNNSACTAFSATYVLDRVAPSAPTGVTRTDPVAQPGVDTTPTFQVTGLTNGNPVRLFSNNTCATQIGSGTASGTTATFSTNPLGSDGTYNVYATQLDAAGNQSACSTAFGTYTLDASAPTLTVVHIESGGGKAVAGVGGQAFLTFTASEPLQSQTVTILGQAASVSQISSMTYRAVYTFTGSDPGGAVTFSIDYTDQASNSGPTVTATTDASTLTLEDGDNAPTFTIANQNGAEQAAFSLDVNDASTGNDTDADAQAISYTCFYDTTVDGVVSMSQACSALAGFSIGASTGAIGWTPSYTAAGVYELRVIGTDGTVDGERTFTLTIANTNRAPVMRSVDDAELVLADILTFNMYDANTLGDVDLDGDAITYSCVYDTTIDGSVVATSNCSELDGLNFSPTSGFFTWTIQPTTPGDFEFKIVGSDGTDSDDEIFTATVTIDISRLPQLAMVGSSTTSYVASLSNDNEVTLNGLPIGGAGPPTIYQVGDTFTITATAGDLLECTGGCFAITPIQGTAAWSTQTYSGTLLSTYMGRYSISKIVVAAFDQAANISINQNGVTHATGSVPSNSVVEFAAIPHIIGSLWIQSDAPVSAYVSTNTSYNDDGRVITAPGKEVLAFVSGGGGAPSGVSTTANGTTVDAYRNDGTNFLNQALNINGIVTVTSGTTQNPAAAAIAVYADKPVVVTQHADGDGVNSTPSLPKSMLSTHFVTPMDGDYASFASFQPGEVIILNSSGSVVSRNAMTRAGGAHAKAPYAFSHNPALIATGTRYVCTTPCIGIFEPLVNDDETLMTGTLMDPMAITSSSFADGGVIPADYVGNRASECSGDNDFPNLAWSNLPWGTQYLAVLVEDESNGDFVHLNLVDVNPASGSLGKIDGVAGDVTFPSGIEGTNGYATAGWSGPCDDSGTHTYRFKVYAMSAAIGGAVNNMTQATFESTYATTILGSASLTGTYGP